MSMLHASSTGTVSALLAPYSGVTTLPARE
jgi:hypothetical protein